jgi:hypothetical protein
MDRHEFIKQQFLTLRDEVRETKARIFKIQSLGLVIVPASSFLGKAYDVDILIVTTPLLVIVVGLMFLFEINALMRCGEYIKDRIEPIISDVEGWEEWLQIPEPFDKRRAELYNAVAFLLLFAVYFLASVYLAYSFATTKYSIATGLWLTAGYIAVGIWFFIFLVQNLRLKTSPSS